MSVIALVQVPSRLNLKIVKRLPCMPLRSFQAFFRATVGRLVGFCFPVWLFTLKTSRLFFISLKIAH